MRLPLHIPGQRTKHHTYHWSNILYYLFIDLTTFQIASCQNSSNIPLNRYFKQSASTFLRLAWDNGSRCHWSDTSIPHQSAGLSADCLASKQPANVTGKAAEGMAQSLAHCLTCGRPAPSFRFNWDQPWLLMSFLGSEPADTGSPCVSNSVTFTFRVNKPLNL